VAACVKLTKKAFGCVNDHERHLPQWIRREILPTSNPLQPIVDNEKCFIRGVNASLQREIPLNRRNFYNENYVDLPESYPVEVKTMIKFAEANDIDMHLYAYAPIDQEFIRECRNYVDLNVEGVVYSVYNSPKCHSEQKRIKVYLLLYKNHVFPIRNPGKILTPRQRSPAPIVFGAGTDTLTLI
jgi:hypothetical protein